MQGQIPASTDQTARMITLIAVALVASVLAYMAIAWFVAPTAARSSDDTEFIQLMAATPAGASVLGPSLWHQCSWAGRKNPQWAGLGPRSRRSAERTRASPLVDAS
jgi:hypothetical protein